MNLTQLEDLVAEVIFELYYPYEGRKNCGGTKAEKLVLCTIIHESECGEYISQYPSGPALGICQMEPNTYVYTWSVLDDRKDRFEGWTKLYKDLNTKFCVGQHPFEEQLKWNNALAISMCRIYYLLQPGELPDVDIDKIANYWFENYNKSKEDVREERINSFKDDIKEAGVL